MLIKRKLFIVALLAVGIWLIWAWFKPVRPESRFRALFADLSVGVPRYQKFHGFSQPEDALKGDFCTADFVQSDTQFREFVSRLGVSPDSILSSTSSWIRADSKMSPKYPWMLQVRAHLGSTSNTYDVHIDGRQPYD
jgi:hypothetical protein